ncbi:MAG TPA: SDR family NAD(P)-dependent oxidoreductase [Myxococcota bacterium]|nr:SDR family NAD(P)-dependent oxidoreductase [Myxococcota bacterium]
MNRLQGKVALITGAARGLGLAIARRFVEEGASVILNDVDESAADKAASPLGGLGIGADVSDSAAVRRMFATVAKRFGRLDILVNNAGISGVENDPELRAKFRDKQLQQAAELAAGGPIRTHLDAAVEVTDEAWHRMLAVHLDGTFFCSREALKIMNPQLSGTIINMGSIMGTSGGAGAVAYCAAKAGILGFTRALAREVVTRNIRVNAIAPGWIETDMTAFLDQMKLLIEASTPMHRLGEPDDIAWAAVYLASEEAKFVTGQVLSPNGGWHMSQ